MNTRIDHISIVIPVYEAESYLGRLYDELTKCFKEWSYSSIEVILVEDGSRDESWKGICEIVDRDQRFSGIRLSRNFGQHNALLCGLLQAKGEVIVTLDDDLQYPPEEIPNLVAELEKGFDLVYGVPQTKQQNFLKSFASWATRVALSKTMSAENARFVGPFRAFRASLWKDYGNYRSPQISIDVLLSWTTTNVTGVEVRHARRQEGQSQYSLTKLLDYAINLVTGFSAAPLRIATWIGFSLTLFGFVAFAFVLIRFALEGTPMPGFTFLASLICVFSGAQLLSIGLIGEYLSRMHFRTIDKPPYLIATRIGPGDPSKTSQN